jgi:site-specific recombinase XerD
VNIVRHQLDPNALASPGGLGIAVPVLVAEAGDHAARRFVDFFTVTIRNKHTRRAYARACWDFMEWMDEHARGVDLAFVQPTHVAMWVEHLGNEIDAGGLGLSPPTIKQRLAAVRMLFDWLVVGHVLRDNPAAAVKGPRHVVKVGKTPVLDAQQARELIDSIDVSTPAGLRDRALIGTMVYSFARVGAVVKMDVRDYWPNGKRWWLRLHEKGGKHHEVLAHHKAEAGQPRRCPPDADPAEAEGGGRWPEQLGHYDRRANILR